MNIVRKVENLSIDHHFTEEEILTAIKNKEFTLHYQPQVLAKNGEIIGFEALIRWNHPDLGIIPPNDFIPLTEATGLIVPVGEWIVNTACKQIKEWQILFKKPFKIAVNLSIKQFHDYNLVNTIETALAEADLDPQFLDIELTESVSANIEVIMSTIKKLKDLGVGISIDDFGRGYSSLYYLKELPVNKLKLDRSFIVDIHNWKDQTIVKSMISMAKGLNLELVAEGIETKEQMEIFSKHCDYLQGFYISKPLSKKEAKALLKKHLLAS
ncbi:putative bifunctional diguanylate cyclase/phosphodiesterase [Cytobacillus oceanisediminis]|uniref:putative bifunctional diguanylate cyclase/phosphodiesterase n=1 Tax=Cytobacillus oceanisediminis TaxID=665099 RepID=UPI000FA70D5D|nr:EAL domain-containing protein [Cytobacillus oceanisediminis]MDK7667320.1 EAL domain-containing protein [Cytobacillus oceanisediminis]